MTIYYVDSSAVAGTQDGLTKENAFLSLSAALLVATASGDEIRCHHGNITLLTVDTTFTIASPALSIISWDFAADRPAVGYRIGHTSANRSISFVYGTTPASGERVLRVFGLDLYLAGSTSDSINLFTAHSGLSILWEWCSFIVTSTATASRIRIGGGGEYHGVQIFRGCDFTRARAEQCVVLGDHRARFYDCRFISNTATTRASVFEYLEQGADTYLETCDLIGYFVDLLTGTVSGTRVVTMRGGRIYSEFSYMIWPSVVFHFSEAGLWGCTRIFEDVTVTHVVSQQSAVFSAIVQMGMRWHWYFPLNPESGAIPERPALFMEAESLFPDLDTFLRPALSIKLRKNADTLPTFWRLYFVGDPVDLGTIRATGVFTYTGFDGTRNVRKHTDFQERHYALDDLVLVEDPTPSISIANWATQLEASEVAYVDIPRNVAHWGTENDNLEEYHSWEAIFTLHIRPGFSGYLYPQVLVDGILETTAVVQMVGGSLVQTYQESNSYPEPIPGYKTLTIVDGILMQPDITINEPPTGTPVVWDGINLRSLLPGESVILQNP